MNTPHPRRLYWDSAAFIAYLKNEEGRVEKCAQVLDAAERGEAVICTSALTLTEVVRGKNLPIMTAENSAVIKDVFNLPFLEIYGFERSPAEKARNLCWKYGSTLHGNDAIHVETARFADVVEFHSFNGKLNKLLQVKDDLPFTISEPRVHNGNLPFNQ